jgi:tRNA uridine 5-carboxymethylaminomethyl modification enzyme
MATNIYDVIVIGAGHAGIEAALASSRLDLRTLLTTNNLDRIGYMSCNPSIGGLAKGHIVKEIDILGGAMGATADATCIQFRRLNASKGPAVRGSRAQCDKELYSKSVAKTVRESVNLDLSGAEIKGLKIEGEKCVGVICQDDSVIQAKAVVVTTGTFMNAVMHFGLKKVYGGRFGDQATHGISDQLCALGFSVKRLKTGTPARAFRNSIDWSKTVTQPGDDNFIPFSFRSAREVQLPQINCFITHTNAQTHEIIRENLDKSPMFCGVIEGIGPRYCPSIEDKITRFADKERHQSFLEPEGLENESIYIQGMSTSLPEDVQYKFLQTMPGLENVKLIRPGYAVEYDFVEPTQLWPTLETKAIAGLYLAGQVNGTSGYEEAAGQGLIAGANAALKVLGRKPLVLGRDQAYLGVLVDDLVTRGTREPYRMMTSRAEHRLVLREDNTLERLGVIARDTGLISEALAAKYDAALLQRKTMTSRLKDTQIVPNEKTQEILREIGTPVLTKPISLADLLRRNEVGGSNLKSFGFSEEDISGENFEAVEINIKYSGYIERQNEVVRQMRDLDQVVIPSNFLFSKVHGLSKEEEEKLTRVRPWSLGQAQRISGINPSAIQAILFYLRANGRPKRQAAKSAEDRPE